MKRILFSMNPLIFASILLTGVSCDSQEIHVNEPIETNPDNTLEYEENATLWLTTLNKTSLIEKQQIAIKDPSEIHPDAVITIDASHTYQEIDGFGYTLTGGSAMLMNKMSDAARSDLLHELFGTGEGELGVSYLRVSIGASDLSMEVFSYDDLPPGETDVALDKFSLSNDRLHLIPVLKEILEIAPDIKIMGSPWSAPTWMKDNNKSKGGSLEKKYYPVYARYFVKYIRAMEAEGVTIDAITIQNEPLHAGNNPSMYMTALAQADFIKNHLGPLFEAENIDTKIVIWDHNADRPEYPIKILSDPEAAQYIDGSAFHLYSGSIDALSVVHEAFPDKNIYFTEQWVGTPGNFAGDFSWHIENLIIGATRNWSRNVLEWNLAADKNEDPHTDGGCTLCLGAITITGDEVTQNPAYYIIGQASKFVRPGSVRIASNMPKQVPNVAFMTPSGQIAVIIQNSGQHPKNIQVKNGDEVVNLSLGTGAVGTLILKPN